MQRLPIVVQKWNNFIWEKPQVVVKILEKNGIKVSSKPTLPELIKKSMVGVANGNEGLINDIDYVIENGDYNGLVILTAIAIGTSIAKVPIWKANIIFIRYNPFGYFIGYFEGS